MAWYKRYSIPFVLLVGNEPYEVAIYEQTDGNVVVLTGSATPFVTRENDVDDIFTPLRGQTGTLSVIDDTEDGSLMETLMPMGNTEKVVKLFDSNGNVRWQGFLCAEAFTQPWDNQKKVVEFTVQSMLNALACKTIPNESMSSTVRIGYFIRNAFNSLALTPTRVVVCSHLTSARSGFLDLRFNLSVFFSQNTVSNDDEEETLMFYGETYGEVLESVLRLFGLSAREDGETIYIAGYDMGTSVNYESFLWSDVGDGNPESSGTIGFSDLIQSVTFRGIDNACSFIYGRRRVAVSLEIDEGAVMKIELPNTIEDDSQPLALDWAGHAIDVVYVQSHEPRVSGYEQFYFYNLKRTVNPDSSISYAYDGVATYNQCYGNSIMGKFDPSAMYPYYYYALALSTPQFFTGAFPIRWFFKKFDTPSNVTLQSGLFLVLLPLSSRVTMANHSLNAYRISSVLEYKPTGGGYFNIDFVLSPFFPYTPQEGYTFGRSEDFPDGYDWKIYVKLRCGYLHWNGTNWQNTETEFTIDMKDERIKSNYSVESTMSNKTSGWFIPVPDRAGQVTLTICNVCECAGQYVPTSFILSNLDFSFIADNELYASQRNTNLYAKKLLQPFSDSETISLRIGTINNNVNSSVFVRDSNGLIQKISYDTGDFRPEMHLLSRMASQYGEMRRTYQGVLQAGADFMLTCYRYIGRKFFGVKYQHNWRDETESVKFIEIS